MKYILTHRKITGSIIIEYDNDGRIRSFMFDCEVSDDLWQFLMNNFPATEDVLQDQLFKNFIMNQVPEDTSFSSFWNAYGYKVGNKTRAEKLYNVLSDPERARVMVSIRKYKAYLASHPTQEMCYAETFLNQRRWENSY